MTLDLCVRWNWAWRAVTVALETALDAWTSLWGLTGLAPLLIPFGAPGQPDAAVRTSGWCLDVRPTAGCEHVRRHLDAAGRSYPPPPSAP